MSVSFPLQAGGTKHGIPASAVRDVPALSFGRKITHEESQHVKAAVEAVAFCAPSQIRDQYCFVYDYRDNDTQTTQRMANKRAESRAEGLRLARNIQTDGGPTPGQPVIFLTNYQDAQSAKNAVNPNKLAFLCLKAATFLMKPFIPSASSLVEKIKTTPAEETERLTELGSKLMMALAMRVPPGNLVQIGATGVIVPARMPMAK